MTAMTSGSASSDRIKVALPDGRAAVKDVGEGSATAAERPHGTQGRYTWGPTGREKGNGCRCEDCRRAVRRASKRHAMYGPAYVDGSRAAAHVRTCLAAGMTHHQIALHAGLSDGGRTVCRHLLSRPGRRIRPETERALLSVPVAPCLPISGATIDATGCRRRVQALVAIGWTETEIARRLGATFPMLQSFNKSRCRGDNAVALHRLYDELADIPGPSTRARVYARRNGWLGPLWWDEDTIDDPTVEPQGIREYDEKGRLLRDLTAHRMDEVERLHGMGVDPVEIAARLGVSYRQVMRDLFPLREACTGCGRRARLRQDGAFRRHRIDANNPDSPYCEQAEEEAA